MKQFILLILYTTLLYSPAFAIDQYNCTSPDQDILTKEEVTEQLRPRQQIPAEQNYEQTTTDDNQGIPYQDIEPEQNMFTQDQSDYDDEPYDVED